MISRAKNYQTTSKRRALPVHKPKVFNPKTAVGDLRTFYSNEFNIPNGVLTEPREWQRNEGQVWKTWPLEWQGIKGFAAQRVH